VIAVGVVASWVIIAIAVGVLWAGWGVLRITFDMVDRWHRR
jgi:hypothetical protein